MKRCLIVSGGYAPHRPIDAGTRVQKLLEAEGFAVVHSDRLSAYDEEDLDAFDLIVPNWTVGDMSVETSKRLWDAVAKSGVGLAGFHGGMADGFRNNDRFRFIVGGSYVAEPGAITDYTVEIVRKDDPITCGIENFSYRSEQYYLQVDPAVDVLAVTRFDNRFYQWIDGVVMPTVWKKRFGAGRVFFSALGHVPEELDVLPARSILLRGLLWAAR